MTLQAENCPSGLRLMLHVLVGLTDAHKRIEVEENNKIFKRIKSNLLSLLRSMSSVPFKVEIQICRFRIV